MKKSLVLASLLALVATSVVASEVKNGAFVGFEIGSTSFDEKAENKTFPISVTDSDSGGSQSLKAGYYFGEMGRAGVSIGRVNIDDGSATSYGLGYDYLIYNSSDFTPFIGATLGYQDIDIDNSSLDLSGLTYGLQVGVDYAINKNFDMELGFRMNFDSNSDTETISGQTIELTIEKVRAWYVGVNYNF